MADQPTTPPSTSGSGFERTADFVSSYANSLILEATAWDLKITFGQLDQISDQTVIKQHLAVCIPWPQAKVALYWLQALVIAHELETGKPIGLRPDVIPPIPPSLTPEQQSNPIMQKYHEALLKLREDFIASLT